MGVALGWMALALAAVAGAPDAGRGGVPIKYTVRFMEVEGLGWREAVFARLTPVTRQGSATVWTAPHDVANRLVEQAKKSPTARILQAPKVIAWSGATAHIIARTNQELVTQAAWNVDENSVQTKPETVRTGSTTTLMGRKLDQGVLVQMVLQDTQVLAVHRITVGGRRKLPIGRRGDEGRLSRRRMCWGTGVLRCGADDGDGPLGPESRYVHRGRAGVSVVAHSGPHRRRSCGRSDDRERQPEADAAAGPPSRRPRSGRKGSPSSSPRRSAAVSDCCSAATTCLSCDEASAARKVALEVPEIGSQEIAGEWLIPKDGILLVSFGPHTVAGPDGKAVVRERLAIVEAAEAAEPAATPRPIQCPRLSPARTPIRRARTSGASPSRSSPCRRRCRRPAK